MLPVRFTSAWYSRYAINWRSARSWHFLKHDVDTSSLRTAASSGANCTSSSAHLALHLRPSS
eukprot:13842453-Heterocapsa_arctica.AAC.1